jgi:lactoylglutathione lyase
MKLAKPFFDVGLVTDSIDGMDDFWRGTVGLPFNHALPLYPGHVQHRYDLCGSVFKLNIRSPEETAASGYAELLIARDDVSEPVRLVDPARNKVTLVPVGFRGIRQIGMKLGVRDLDAHRHYYSTVLGFPKVDENSFRIGEGLVLLEHDPTAPGEGSLWGRGWRYLTFQVLDVRAEHARYKELGGREGAPISQLRDVARAALVRDPDGNWIELSQRASLTGPIGDPLPGEELIL